MPPEFSATICFRSQGNTLGKPPACASGMRDQQFYFSKDKQDYKAKLPDGLCLAAVPTIIANAASIMPKHDIRVMLSI